MSRSISLLALSIAFSIYCGPFFGSICKKCYANEYILTAHTFNIKNNHTNIILSIIVPYDDIAFVIAWYQFSISSVPKNTYSTIMATYLLLEICFLFIPIVDIPITVAWNHVFFDPWGEGSASRVVVFVALVFFYWFVHF